MAAVASLHAATAARRRVSAAAVWFTEHISKNPYASFVSSSSSHRTIPHLPSPTSDASRGSIHDACQQCRSIRTAFRLQPTRAYRGYRGHPTLPFTLPQKHLIIPEIIYPSPPRRNILPWETISSMEHQRAFTPDQEHIVLPQFLLEPLPIWQISFTNVLDCDNEKWDWLDDFAKMNPIWERVAGNPLVRDSDVYVLSPQWRWLVRSFLLLASYNHSHGYTAAASFYWKNIKVSRRFQQAAFVNALGTKLDNKELREFLKKEGISIRALSYGVIRQLIRDLGHRYQPDVPTPQDVDSLLAELFHRWISPESEELILFNPCLLQNQGRSGLIYQGDFLLRSKFYHIIEAGMHVSDEIRLQMATRKRVLRELGNLKGRNGGPWEDVVRGHPLHLHHYVVSHNCPPPIRHVVYPPFTDEDNRLMLQRGVELCGQQRNSIRHSHDMKARNDTSLEELGSFSANDVIVLQHTDVPLFCTTMVRGFYACGMGPELGMGNFFPIHRESYKKTPALSSTGTPFP